MALSYKQHIFAAYLLKKIGFVNLELIDYYLEKHEIVHGKYIKEWNTETFPNGYIRHYWELKYTNSDCIDELLKEINIKKNLGSIILKNIPESSLISASDISSFNFCPASYSILKSFEIEHPTNEDKRLNGIDLHESLRLMNKKIPSPYDENYFVNEKVLENDKIKKIKNCELIFAGHSKEKKYFINKDTNYIGQPDYIFKDPNNKYFVVEEKFKYLSRSKDYYNDDYEIINKNNEKLKKYFFQNHELQIQSYIENIKEYDIEYGILIYWYYDLNSERPYIHDVSLKTIKKGENSQLLEETINDLKNLINNKSMDFTINIRPTKCVACSVNKYCSHKTSELKNLTFPYNRYFMNLKYVEFPEELKRDPEN